MKGMKNHELYKNFVLLLSNFLFFVKGLLLEQGNFDAASCRRSESGSKLPHSTSATVSCDESEPHAVPASRRRPYRLPTKKVKPTLAHGDPSVCRPCKVRVPSCKVRVGWGDQSRQAFVWFVVKNPLDGATYI